MCMHDRQAALLETSSSGAAMSLQAEVALAVPGKRWLAQSSFAAPTAAQVGFEEEMRQIVALLPKDRQTMLFSATQSNKVRLASGS